MSLEEIFQQKVCICLHSIEEEHEFGKCFALDFNGAIWIACRCTTIKVLPLSFKVERYEVSTNPTNKATSKLSAKSAATSATKETKLPVFQWGKKTS